MAIDISTVRNLVSPYNAITGKENSFYPKSETGISSFESLLNSAIGMVRETENYTNAAEEAEMSYMLGLNDSMSDLMVAQAKATMSLQYTVAVRNAVIEAYKEIMQLQF